MSSTDPFSLPPELQQALTYRVGESIAEGGMGAVLRAEDIKIQRTVAMKVLLEQRTGDAEALRRFLLEARVLGQLEHPNIVPLYQLGLTDAGQPFYTMKLVRGVTLREVLEGLKNGDAETVAKYPFDQLLTIFQKVCDAISFAHSRGVIHRDLKPENIMLGDFGEVLVMDWGLAKIITEFETESSAALDVAMLQSSARDGAGMRTMEGSVMGTPYFMAPEQAEGRVNELDVRTDVFALGGILYNLLTLHPPVGGDTVQQVLENILTGYIPPPLLYNKVKSSQVRPAGADGPTAAKIEMAVESVNLLHLPGGRVPEALSAVAMKALAVAPERRYQTVVELQKDITAYQKGFATSAEEAGFIRQIRLLIERNKSLAAAVAAMVMLSIGFMAKVLSSEHATLSTLQDLRATAPTFYDQARSLVESAAVLEALEKIDFALKLQERQPAFLLLRANILQTLQRLPEARTNYQLVLELDPTNKLAQINLELCNKLDEKIKGKEWPLDALKSFQKALDDQGRSAEALYLNRFLSKDNKALYDTWKSKLKTAGISPNRMTVLANGRFDLAISDPMVDDLSPLKGMPIEKLSVANTKIISLGPLRGMTLTSLDCSGTLINSLEPLREMPLTWLNINGTEVTDLEPLQGMALDGFNAGRTHLTNFTALKDAPLHFLNLDNATFTEYQQLTNFPLNRLILDNTAIADLTHIARLPLKDLELRRCRNIVSLEPLKNCKQLERISLPTSVNNFLVLRQIPTLRIVEYDFPLRTARLSVEDFMKFLDEQGKLRIGTTNVVKPPLPPKKPLK